MAFQAPTAERQRISPIRVNSSTYHEAGEIFLDTPSSPSLSRHIYTPAADEEWVVFSPTISSRPSIFASETVTDDASRASKFGSLLEDSDEQSHRISSSNEPSYGIFDEADYSEVADTYREDHEYEARDNDLLVKEEGDADSLNLFQSRLNENQILLPTHDGRGMFPPLSTTKDERAMHGLVSLEESLRQVAGHNETFNETDDLNSRIQKWRNEQKTALLEEVERSKKRNATQEADEASLLMLGEDSDIMKEDADPKAEQASKEGGPSETFLRRITRTVMRDIMGIDDNILEIIFGESLPLEPVPGALPAEGIQQTWERGLLDRIARELGVLIQHYTKHPAEAAFSSYSRWGLETTEEEEEAEGTKTPKPIETVPEKISQAPQEPTEPGVASPYSISSRMKFQPTLPSQPYELSSSAAWGIDDHEDITGSVADVSTEAQRRKEYWEQELGVRVFFSYLKSRFSAPPPPPPRARKQSATPELKPIYHQHPLIQRRYRRSVSGSSRAGPSPIYTPGASWSFGGALGLGGYRTGSSCASESTRRSKIASRTSSKGKGKSKRTQGGSVMSKGYYWEVDTSVGSGRSCVGVGVWGEI